MILDDAILEFKKGKRIRREAWEAGDYIEPIKNIKFTALDGKEHIIDSIIVDDDLIDLNNALYGNILHCDGKYTILTKLSKYDMFAKDWIVCSQF